MKTLTMTVAGGLAVWWITRWLDQGNGPDWLTEYLNPANEAEGQNEGIMV